MFRLALHWQILIALFLGAVIGSWLWQSAGFDPQSAEALTGDWQPSGWISTTLAVAEFFGDLFIQALKMLIVPLIVTAVVGSISKLQGMAGFARLGGKTLGFYLLSSTLAIATGLICVNLMKPGELGGNPNQAIAAAFEHEAQFQAQNPEDSRSQRVAGAGEREMSDISDIFLRMFPENVLQAATQNGQLLGIIVFSILFAIAVTRLEKEQAEPMQKFFESAHYAMLVLTNWVMKFAPLGLLGLITGTSFKLWGLYDENRVFGEELLQGLGRYFATVLSALGIHFFVTLPLLLLLLAKVNPLKHYRAMITALLNAFSTASSSATLPLTMRAAEQKIGVSKRVASFTLPLGATVNMDGTALYECVAVLFVAQVMNIAFGIQEQFLVVVLALLTSIGVAGIPSASMVAILLILKNTGIPHAEAAIGVLFSVDRLLDMSRTAVNVCGDSVCATVVSKSEGDELFASSLANK